MPIVYVGLKLVVVATSMKHFCLYIQNSFTHQVTLRKRSINQITIVFVSEQDYKQPHTNDGILSIEGHCTIKRIVAKCSGQNIITILCGTNISKAKKGHNDDDDDNDIDILNEAIEAPNDINYHEL